MRTLQVLLLTCRLLFTSIIIYNLTRFLPTERRSRIRYRNTLAGARMIADFCLQMGGIYFKAAQYLSTVSNVFDAEFTEIFARVSDRAEARPYKDIRYRMQTEFSEDPESLFLEFDRTPFAAASLGQVHIARLQDGRKVAVKMLHPRMETIIRRDLRALRYVIRMINVVYSHLDFRSHLSEFANMVYTEIDYKNEAENIRRARDQFKDDDRVVIPDVIGELTGATVLTTEYIEGIQVNDYQSIDQVGIDRSVAAELLIEVYMRMFFDHRFYHADPHPGNIFLIKTDINSPIKIAFVDFGATKDVTSRTFDLMRRFIEIIRTRDIPAMVDLAIESELLDRDADREAYTNLFELIHGRYGSFKVDEYYRINPVRFGRIIRTRDLETVGLRLREVIADMKLPRNYIYLGRTLTMLLSLATRLDDRANLFMIARPHVDRYLGTSTRGILSALRRGNLRQLLRRVVGDRKSVERQLIIQKNEDAATYYRLGQQAIYAACSISLAFLGLSLYEVHLDALASYAAYGAVGFGIVFLYKVIRGRKRKRKRDQE